MTTVAYKDGILAADSQSCLGDVIYENDCQKLFVDIGPFAALGIAGNYQDAMDVIDLASAYTSIDQIRNISFKEAGIKASFLAITYDGKLWYYAGDCSFEMRPDIPFAMGSGGDYAWGAMLAGKTASEAVKIASQVDTGTNDRVQIVDLTKGA